MNRIKDLRKELGQKQKELAEIMSVSQVTVSNWENGIYEPDLKSLGKLSELFCCSVDYIMGHSNIRNAPETGKSTARKRIDAAVEGMTDAELDWFADQIEGLKRIWSEKK